MYPHTGELPLDPAQFPMLEGVLELVYNPRRTALAFRAAELGIPCGEGLAMLVAQAKAAEELFFDRAIEDAENERILKLLRQSTQNIVLIGMPGSGKSTIGQLLAKQLGMAFADTDALVEAVHGPIPGIFSAQGEVVFRHYEQQAAEKSAGMMRTVIATGGGIVHTEAAMKALRESGIVVYVDRPLAQLLKDTKTEGRPLLASGRDALTGLYEKRHTLYKAFADITVANTAGAQTCVSNILKNLEAYKNEDTRA